MVPITLGSPCPSGEIWHQKNYLTIAFTIRLIFSQNYTVNLKLINLMAQYSHRSVWQQKTENLQVTNNAYCSATN